MKKETFDKAHEINCRIIGLEAIKKMIEGQKTGSSLRITTEYKFFDRQSATSLDVVNPKNLPYQYEEDLDFILQKIEERIIQLTIEFEKL